MRAAGSEAEARRIVKRLFERFRDGHVGVTWPTGAQPTAVSGEPAPLCRRLGYDAAYVTPGVIAGLAGYRPLPSGNAFRAGLFRSGGRVLGAIRIGMFAPQGYPALCEQVARDLNLPAESPCDDPCADRVLTQVYRLFTENLINRVAELKAAGAEALFIDIGGNGGGSEWVEAAARIVTAKRITSAERAYVRGPHWAKIWRSFEADFRAGARTAKGVEKAQLLAWADQARTATVEAERDCTGANDCPRLASGGYATGMVGAALPCAFRGKPWATTAFSIAQYDYREGVWDGPLVVLVDQETWSAAEEFAAVLQDNNAAVILGARTGGAGCGHVNGGTPTTLSNSKGVLTLPDCARLRRDGSNEVNGIIPNVAVPLRHDDGMALKIRLIEAKLPEALARAGLRL